MPTVLQTKIETNPGIIHTFNNNNSINESKTFNSQLSINSAIEILNSHHFYVLSNSLLMLDDKKIKIAETLINIRDNIKNPKYINTHIHFNDLKFVIYNIYKYRVKPNDNQALFLFLYQYFESVTTRNYIKNFKLFCSDITSHTTIDHIRQLGQYMNDLLNCGETVETLLKMDINKIRKLHVEKNKEIKENLIKSKEIDIPKGIPGLKDNLIKLADITNSYFDKMNELFKTIFELIQNSNENSEFKKSASEMFYSMAISAVNQRFQIEINKNILNIDKISET